jgi:hypothetical protein
LLLVKICLQNIKSGAWTGLIWLMIDTNGSEIEGDFLTGFAASSRDSLQAAAVAQLAFRRRNVRVGSILLCGRNEQATSVQAHMHTGLVQPAARSKEIQK